MDVKSGTWRRSLEMPFGLILIVFFAITAIDGQCPGVGLTGYRVHEYVKAATTNETSPGCLDSANKTYQVTLKNPRTVTNVGVNSGNLLLTDVRYSYNSSTWLRYNGKVTKQDVNTISFDPPIFLLHLVVSLGPFSGPIRCLNVTLSACVQDIAPEVSFQSTSDARFHDEITLRCTIKGQPFARIVWHTLYGFTFHTKDVENQYDIRGDFHNSTLRITKVRLSEDGFTCRVSSPPCLRVICSANYPGSTRTNSIARNLDVFPASPENIQITRIWPRSVLTTWKKPKADYITNYTFFGIALTSNRGPRRDNIPVTNLQATEYSNVLNNLAPCTYYAIQVSSVNYLGESSWTQGNFTTPAGLVGVTLSIHNVSSSSVSTTWGIQEQLGNGCKVNNATKFLIRYKCLNGLSDLSLCSSLFQTNASNNLRSKLVGMLNPATTYQISVTALTTQADYNVTSGAIEFVTNDSLPVGTPNNLHITHINSTAVIISWEDIQSKHKHGKIFHFKAEAVWSGQNVAILAINFTAETTKSTVITGLNPCSSYTFRLSGCNSVGCGPNAQLSFRTLDKPINSTLTLDLHLNESNPLNIFLTATAVGSTEPEICVTGFTVQYRKMYGGNLTETKRSPFNRSVSIFDLEPVSVYLVRSRLVGYSSFGTWTEFSRVATNEGKPSAVRDLKLIPQPAGFGNVTWEAPSRPNGMITHYVVKFHGTRHYNSSFIHVESKSAGNLTNIELSRLFPATYYRITVYATNAKYKGVVSSITYESEAMPPLRPSEVKLDESTIIHSQVRATAKHVNADNGPISGYQVIVLRGIGNLNVTGGPNKLPGYYQALALNLSYYITLKLSVFNDSKSFFIGDGKSESGHFNAPLSRSANYTVFIRAVTIWQGRTLYSRASATALYRYPVRSRPLAITASRKMTSFGIQLIQLQQNVKYVRIIVQKLDSLKAITSIPHPNQYPESNITVYTISKKMKLSLPYVAAELSSAVFVKLKTFFIGVGNRTSRTITRKRRNVLNSTSFWNGPLDPGSSYSVFFRVYHSDLVYYSSAWSDPFVTLPAEPVAAAPRASTVGLIIGVVLCVLAIPCFIILGILLWKRYKKVFEAKCHFSNMELVTNNSTDNNGTANHSFSDDVFDPEINTVQSSDFVLQYPLDMSHPPIPTADYIDYVDAMKDKDYAFEDEFQELSDGPSGSKRTAKKQCNADLNRDTDFVPFDNSRVILEHAKKGNTDYINAAYIDGLNVKNAYIATQAPLTDTMKDFWAMVWQQKVRTIVMLTHILDEDKTNSPCYWPSKQKLSLGDIAVESKDTVFDDCSTVRAFMVAAKKMTPRLVRHFQFNKWPERGVPNSVNNLLAFRDLVNNWHKGKNSPMVIHCSNGCGRTGTYIALDALLKNFRTSKTVDVFNYVNYLRSRRTGMVETDRQYEFIYKAILEVFMKHDMNTEMTKRNAKELHRSLIMMDPLIGCSGFGKIFKVLHRGLKTESSIIKHFEGSKAINDYKNRYSFKVPHDSFRVRLPVFGSAKSNSSDYINATLVALSDSSRFITTQAPFGITINDFWTMVHFSRADVIISLNDLEEGKAVFTQFWPTGEVESAVYGNFRVVLELETTPFPCVIRRDFTLSELGHPDVTKEVTQFHMLGWQDHDTPTSRIAVLELCKHIVSEYMSDEKPPVIVQCSDGFGRSGTFCACTEAVKGMMNNGVVDIQSIVRKFKERNTAYVENVAQFKFIFDIALDYVARRG